MKQYLKKRWWYFYHKDSEGQEYYYGREYVMVPTRTKIYKELQDGMRRGSIYHIRYCTEAFSAAIAIPEVEVTSSTQYFQTFKK